MIPVILSGGSGTRLWPISRAKFPKQFNDLFEEPLQNLTLKRLASFGPAPMIITSIALRDFTEKKAIEAGFPQVEIVYEPQGKNTAPAIAVLCKVLELKGLQNEVVGVFPADHLVDNLDVFLSALDLAEKGAKQGKVVTLGLKPKTPETGYGYIQTQRLPHSYNEQLSSFSVVKFHEKPDAATARQFLSDGSYFWNAGIFVFPVQLMIDLFKKYQPQIWQSVSGLKVDRSNIKDIYAKMPSISIDYAIIEKLSGEELLCVPCDPGWSDVGSWDAVAEVYERTGRTRGTPFEVNSKNNFVLPSRDKRYALVGVEDLIVVDTEDALLISSKGNTQDVKTVVEYLKAEDPKLANEHVFEERPWGRFEVLRDKEHFKSKVIVVNAKSQISYQSHAKREEHWIMVRGAGEVVINGEITPVQAGSYVKIPLGAKHRIRNPNSAPLEFIEVQLGTYFGEDDIIRYQDDYKRT
ncbi:MAG: mannose-1-phosphate guanylyltransferase/mannose-6-phosphate isomerase [Bdellovibrio sp.]|jgi:mannose-1-phosphate guanylyltransferase/mannose-6-phosphate isomerase